MVGRATWLSVMLRLHCDMSPVLRSILQQPPCRSLSIAIHCITRQTLTVIRFQQVFRLFPYTLDTLIRHALFDTSRAWSFWMSAHAENVCGSAYAPTLDAVCTSCRIHEQGRLTLITRQMALLTGQTRLGHLFPLALFWRAILVEFLLLPLGRTGAGRGGCIGTGWAGTHIRACIRHGHSLI